MFLINLIDDKNIVFLQPFNFVYSYNLILLLYRFQSQNVVVVGGRIASPWIFIHGVLINWRKRLNDAIFRSYLFPLPP